MKRKPHDKGEVHSRQSGGPIRKVAIRRRHQHVKPLTEILLSVFLLGSALLIGGVYYYHFKSKSSPDSIIPVHLDKVSRESSLLVSKIQPKHASNDSSLHVLRNQPKRASNNLQHLVPKVPSLPAFVKVPNAERLMADTLDGKPTIAGITAILQKFLMDLHVLNFELVDNKDSTDKVIDATFELINDNLLPLDVVYRNKPIFPIREDDSIFMSLAAFREHLLMQTLVGAFSNAKSPDKLFIGAVVQNCFGKIDKDGTIHSDGLPCRTGAQVIGKNAKGRDQTKVSDAPPDKNGIELFCTDPDYKKYCDAGQIRVLYVHETESLGPAMARYFASKLWGGETYFMQSDSHLQFAAQWDAKFIMEAKATMNYPKSVLSSYPPGHTGGGKEIHAVDETNGARLCACSFSDNAVEHKIIRINTGGANYKGDEERPTQIPFIAAGFFLARAEFLVDVPFDPFMPWCFMGEEIALSVRAWTSGWNIYAPRKNLISHQYRPGRMGLPKFFAIVNRLFHGPANYNHLKDIVIQRVKNLIGYADNTKEIIVRDGHGIILGEQDHYGLGHERTLNEYLVFAGIDMEKETCSQLKWCHQQSLQ